MFLHYRTQGFVLKKNNQGEADQLLTIFTKDFGKLEILAKGIRKISSKLKSGVEIFYLSKIEFIQGKSYKTLTDALLIEKFENIKKDFKKLKIAYQIVERIDNLIKGPEKDEKLWRLILEVFSELNKLKIENFKLDILFYYFLWKFFLILGYQPELYHCVICHKKIKPEKNFFTLKENGLICQNCHYQLKLGRAINLTTIKILRLMSEKKWNFVSKLKIEKKDLISLRKISNLYYLYLFNQLKSI